MAIQTLRDKRYQSRHRKGLATRTPIFLENNNTLRFKYNTMRDDRYD